MLRRTTRHICRANEAHFLNDDALVVFLDFHEHVTPCPVVVVVLECRYGNQHILQILEAHILTLRKRGEEEE